MEGKGFFGRNTGRGTRLIRAGVSVACMILLTGCQSIVNYDLPNQLQRDIARRQAVDSDVRNNLQVLLYAGMNRNDDLELANAALATCLDIVGWPDPMEKEYASHLTRLDVQALSEHTGELLTEQSQLNARINKHQERMTNEYYKYGAVYSVFSAIKQFLSYAIPSVLIFILLFFFLRRV